MAVKGSLQASSPRAKALAEERMRRQRERQAVLATLDCVHGTPDEELARLVELCTLRVFGRNDPILNAPDQGKAFYIILHGSVQLNLRDKAGHEVLLGILSRGDCFGENALFGSYFRGARVIAESVCYILQIPLSNLREVLPTTPMLGMALRRIYRRRLVESALARVPIFSQLSPIERMTLANFMQSSHYARGIIIVSQGDPGEAFYLIESGQVVIEHDAQTIALLNEGDFFGEMSLLQHRPHNATVRAHTPVDTVALPAEAFRDLLQQHPDLKTQLMSVVEQRLTNRDNTQNNRERSRMLSQIVSRGLLRGRALLVRTPELCPPDCQICETACKTRHGQLRLHLNGVQIGNLDIPDTCRQCHVGAECVEVCPENAIEWNDKGALAITDKCVGCGKCVEACPYNAVASVPLPNRRNGPFRHIQDVLGRLNRRNVIPLDLMQPTHRADKCDFCNDYDDMICLSSCPTGSLRLVWVEELFPF